MIPLAEGLLPEPYNRKLMTLLFHLAEWHALAKLRMHTEHTLNQLDQAIVAIGHELRSFEVWAEEFKPVELPREAEACDCHKHKRASKKASSSGSSGHSAPQVVEGTTLPGPEPAAKSNIKPKAKLFSLFTYKLHALGDYVRTIWLFGTMDSYSTQIVRPHSRSVAFLTLYLYRANLHTTWSNASISRPIRRMQYIKLQSMNSATHGYVAQKKLLLLLRDDMLTMLLSWRVTHFHSLGLTYTTT